MKTFFFVLTGIILFVILYNYSSNNERQEHISYVQNRTSAPAVVRIPITEVSYETIFRFTVQSCAETLRPKVDDEQKLQSICSCIAKISDTKFRKLHLQYEDQIDSNASNIVPTNEEALSCLKVKERYIPPVSNREPLPYVPPTQTFNPDTRQPGCPGCPVHVRGYTRSNGTYVQPYTRSYPHRR